VRVGAEARVRVWVPEGCSGKCLNGMAATRTRRRGRVAGVDARGEAMAQARLGCGRVSRHGSHARARVLATQGRGVAVPCARHWHPGLAAQRGGGKAQAVAGEAAARRVPAQERHGGRKRKGGPTAGYGGFLSGARHHAGSRGGQEKDGGGVAHRRSWSRGRSGQRRGEAGGSRPCRKGCGVDVVVRGAGLVELRWWRRWRPPRSAPGPPPLCTAPPPPSLSLGCGDGGRETGARVARVLGGGRGVLMGAALGHAARARTPRAAMPGVRATATRHASGGCDVGLGFGGVGGRGAGEKGARTGGRLRLLSWSGAARAAGK
jgi:hypothetical protein